MSRKFLFFIVGIFMISSVCALGVSPARTTLDFKPNLQNSVSFELINSGSGDINVMIAAQGELASYITVPQGMVSISAAEGVKSFNYDISLPGKLEPGLHTAEIFILQVPPSGSGNEETSVQATLAVVTQLHVYVPYPGKYANAKMEIINAKDGGVTFVFPVVSAGEFDLVAVKANVDIYTADGVTKVDSFTTSPIGVPSGEKREIVRNWGATTASGDYLALATFIYDEGTQNFNETFSLGSSELILQDISVNSFVMGQIVKLDILVENRWSEDIEGAFIDAKILNDRGDMVSSFESAAHDVPAKSKENFLAYWDTAGVKVGEYEADISIKYGDKSSDSNLRFKVDENELTVIGLGYVISADGGGDGTSSLVVILIIVIVILILVNLLWFLLLRKRLAKK